MREKGKRQQPVPQLVCLFAALILVGNGGAPAPARAAEGQSYQAAVDWLEQHRDTPPTFAPGQTLGLQDRQALEPFIPQSVWAYYFFEDMEMEIAQTGEYPPPPEWGQNVPCPATRWMSRACSSISRAAGFHFQTLPPMTRRLRSRSSGICCGGPGRMII